MFTVPEEELSAAEKTYLAEGKKWQMTEGAYALQQGTKPETLADDLRAFFRPLRG